MILSAHQPVYLPWLGLFHKIALSDTFCIFDDVQYLRKDWNNRNRIKTSSGAVWLSVPVFSSGHRDKKINEIEIDNSSNWRRKHWKSIYLNYKKAPHFSTYADFFEDLYQKDWSNLVELNNYILLYLLKELGIKVKIYSASDFKFEGKKGDLVLDMCKKLDADKYIFGALGKNYADVGRFNEAGIEVYFQDYNHPVYQQINGGFEPYLSVIDLLFNCGNKSLDIIMSNNALIKDVGKLTNKKVLK